MRRIKPIGIVVILALLWIPIVSSQQPGTTALYRWYSSSATDHFYTTDPSGELAPANGYVSEGITGYIATSQQPGTTALYRWYSSSAMDHFYTTDPSGELAPANGYVSEGITGYIATSQQPGTTALYRWYSSSATDHFYTTDPSGELAPASGYVSEGITGYIWTSPQSSGSSCPNLNWDLTGVWNCDDGGKYYIRQIGNTIWWYGDNNPDSPGFSNVMNGTICGNIITLNWADVPKGRTLNSGIMTLKIESSNRISAISKTGGFGGSVWTRGGSNQNGQGNGNWNLGTGDVQVTLSWNANADIDLHVVDPSGDEVYYSNPTVASGGQLDLDNKCSNFVMGKPENIYWPTGKAPRGTYKVSVKYYADCSGSGTPTGPVDWTVTTKVNGNVNTYRGTLNSVGDTQEVTTFQF